MACDRAVELSDSVSFKINHRWGFLDESVSDGTFLAVKNNFNHLADVVNVNQS